jgi:hypothetical protein
LNRAIQLTSGLHEVLTIEKFGLVPPTQTDMNIAAGKDLTGAEEKMASLLSEC